MDGIVAIFVIFLCIVAAGVTLFVCFLFFYAICFIVRSLRHGTAVFSPESK